ncbi:phospholipase D family protein [Azospirillum sp. TSO35-2]|uniref:phospholipase D family protein n=1 Tax=Azospirillum sp. TSO35-2 TaxID=716796 RepID=UPI000D610E98|nr:phospholipase D family protein [Azospirillum sp. TSO35-2]PWC39113.1 hypothetical protein TSO352_02470 [Azospirillum sp. TSO35-2]
MLEPGTRLSMHDVFRPPPGHRFAGGILCTYSVALPTLLSIPAALLDVINEEEGAGMPASAPRLLAAVRRVFDQLLVFCQESRIHQGEQAVPSLVLDAEAIVREVRAPGGGAFHPKLWLLRFVSRDDGMERLRLAVLSRNLTKDRSWDVCAVLEGQPGKGPGTDTAVPGLLRRLPGLCRTTLSAPRQAFLRNLAGCAERTVWRAPPGLSNPVLHVSGLGQSWSPPPSDRLAVFSPFLHIEALRRLRTRTERGVLLVSRPDSLDAVGATCGDAFERTCVLAAPEETGDAPPLPGGGIHAKIYVWDERRRSRIAVGSANATVPALDGTNVEVMAEFDCTAALTSGVMGMVQDPNLSTVLMDYEPDPAQAAAAGAGRDTRIGRRQLIDAGLTVVCHVQPDDTVALALCASKRLAPSVSICLPDLRFWPVTRTVADGTACLDALMDGRPALFTSALDLSEVSGFISFQSTVPGGTETFALNLPVEGLDEDVRRQAVTARILPTEDSVLDFIRMLLGDSVGLGVEPGGSGDGPSPRAGAGRPAQPAILEALVRCAADEPYRLEELGTTIDDLLRTSNSVPDDFRTLWKRLRRAAAIHSGARR